jgi:hypothetical protein
MEAMSAKVLVSLNSMSKNLDNVVAANANLQTRINSLETRITELQSQIVILKNQRELGETDHYRNHVNEFELGLNPNRSIGPGNVPRWQSTTMPGDNPSDAVSQYQQSLMGSDVRTDMRRRQMEELQRRR